MSRPSLTPTLADALAQGPRLVRTLAVLLTVGLGGSVACWEQWGGAEWFPQMKRQAAVQAFEALEFQGSDAAWLPPEGAVPVGQVDTPLSEMSMAETEALRNPRAPTLESLETGREQFEIFCATCHGLGGAGDGAVAAKVPGVEARQLFRGPFAGVLPIGGPTSISKGLSDGHIFTTMSLGRGRMPSYRRIPLQDRWDVLNYIRYLNGQVGVGGTP